MAQLEEQLNQILGDPQAMEQIMSLAQSLSGSRESPPPDQSSPGETEAPPRVGRLSPPPVCTGGPGPPAAADGDDPVVGVLRPG